MSETIHGYPIIARAEVREGEIIVVHREGHRLHPFVTSFHKPGESEWCWGHYCETREEAMEDFAVRVRRGY